MTKHMISLAGKNQELARYLFPGQVFHVQETRKQRERKYRDWSGWLDLVAEYQKDTLYTNRTEPL